MGFTGAVTTAVREYFRWEDRATTSGVRIYLLKFPVLRQTPKGVWLDLGFGLKRFVLTEAKRQYACPTLEAARESFRARKRRQIKIYETRLQQARAALASSLAMEPLFDHGFFSFGVMD